MSAELKSPHTRTYLLRRLESLSNRLVSGVAIPPEDQELLREQIAKLTGLLRQGRRPEASLSSCLADLAFRASRLLEGDDSDFALQLQILDLEVAELSEASTA